jgi:predicted nucleic acid-binding Zn ribbon protein
MSVDSKHKEDYGNSPDKIFYYKCRLCGNRFDNLIDVQRHALTSHVRQGDVPYEKG